MKDKVIRDKFGKYFKEKGHNWYSSLSLVPPDDPTMLFTTAGMVQFKRQFLRNILGDIRKDTRAISIQKCLRTSDIEEVGKTARHLTFFEMYGNFSFGDYFKEEAIKWGWEFLIDILKIDKEKLYATVYKDDDEAYAIWEKIIDKSRIYRLGEKDNFWKMGETGPCGPCAEILYDRGPGTGCQDKNCEVGCECDRYVEVWNLVFTQYDRAKDGTLKELPQKNIDTGMGLERLNQVVNGLDNIYETETLKPLIEKVKEESKNYEKSATRVVADHARAVTFLIGDGVSPSNEGRGYVLRRLIRRALREGLALGWQKPRLFKYTAIVVDMMEEYYPVLSERANHIALVCKKEEESFLETLKKSAKILEEYINEMKKSSETGAESRAKKILSGEKAFKLYDTYGMPLEITRKILAEKGYSVNEDKFNELTEIRADRSRWKEKDIGNIYGSELVNIKETDFTGYEKYSGSSKVLKILEEGKAVILEKTPFYAEAGGQVGDKGKINGKTGDFQIDDTVSINGIYIHKGRLKGKMKEGDAVEALVDCSLRKAIQRNHTATHILQKVLRDALGGHVRQNGSAVSGERMRFDFTHPSALSEEELKSIEENANKIIMNSCSVSTEVMSKEDAGDTGALAFFGEKYGEKVRVVTITDKAGTVLSREFCGGTHVKNTGELGLLKIVTETGIAAGVRRIEAVTGTGLMEYIEEKEELIRRAAGMLNSPASKIEAKINKLKEELKEQESKINSLENKFLSGTMSETMSETMSGKGENIGSVKFIKRDFGVSGQGIMGSWLDSATKNSSVGALAVGKKEGILTLILKISKDLTSDINAGKIIKEASRIVGGGGGGRKDMAQGGGGKVDALDEAVDKIKELLREK
ncbi:MAG: alanine--tRNA ligase [Elusimicrobia bacterium]|jgi:alanyl-tRNA synthetase|nr:alanine--tRNA ligase [Elusimicrobiota bacterium]